MRWRKSATAGIASHLPPKPLRRCSLSKLFGRNLKNDKRPLPLSLSLIDNIPNPAPRPPQTENGTFYRKGAFQCRANAQVLAVAAAVKKK